MKGRLRRGTLEVRLTPKALAVLRHLVQQPGQVATKEEFFRAVWPDTVVSDAALTSCIQELRQALHDEAKTPRYIETVHRRGFRFIATVQSAGVKLASAQTEPVPHPQHLVYPVVGRETELQHLQRGFDKALHGARQIVFVTGEPGIGKTTLADAFLTRLADEHAQDVWIGRGQCIEHYGAGEAYLPVLEALGRLCRGRGGERMIALLNHHAPTWSVQLPALLQSTELEALQRKTAGATRERMLRELAEAIEVVTRERPLVLVLEDLHWSDVSTLDWLAFLARRAERARLLVIGTYRPVEVLTREHPLKAVKQELHLHGQCQELALDFLNEAQVAEYLTQRLVSLSPASVGEDHGESSRQLPFQRLARVIHQRTDGNPLFMVNMLEHWLSQGVLVQGGGQWTMKTGEPTAAVPETLRQMIEQRLAQVKLPERVLLEVASVAGVEFSAATLAAGLGTEGEGVEEQCAELARREQFLRASGAAEWPDGTVAARYRFLHALYQEVLYERLPAGRRQRLHQRIGERQEGAYGERAPEIAPELAVHFERGRDYRRTMRYRRQAAENAARRGAHQEASTHLQYALAFLPHLADPHDREREELTIQLMLATSLSVTLGYGAQAVETALTRAQELCQHVGTEAQHCAALNGLFTVALLQDKLAEARSLGERLLPRVQRLHDQALLIDVYSGLGETLFFQGEFSTARHYLEQGGALYEPQHHHRPQVDHDPGVIARSISGWVLSALGYFDQARQRAHEGIALATELAHPHSLAFALNAAALAFLLQRAPQRAYQFADDALAVAQEYGFPFWRAVSLLMYGWALTDLGRLEAGIQQIHEGLSQYHDTGACVGQAAWIGFTAAAYGKADRIDEALTILEGAFACMTSSGEWSVEPMLHYIKGEVLLRNAQLHTSPVPDDTAIEHCFLTCLHIARRQQAKLWELRAGMGLARLWQPQGKKEDARQLVAEIYGWFTEGFDTKDLQEAKALLTELS